MGLESEDGKAVGVGRGKQKMIIRNCSERFSALTLINSISVHLWMHIWAIQPNPSRRQSQNSLFKLG